MRPTSASAARACSSRQRARGERGGRAAKHACRSAARSSAASGGAGAGSGILVFVPQAFIGGSVLISANLYLLVLCKDEHFFQLLCATFCARGRKNETATAANPARLAGGIGTTRTTGTRG